MYNVNCKCIKDIELYSVKKGQILGGVVTEIESDTVIVIYVPEADRSMKLTWEGFIEYFKLVV